MSRQEAGSSKPDFLWVKSKVTASLNDESTKRLWSSIINWLESDGEESVRKQVEVLTQGLLAEALSKLAELEAKIPAEE